MAQTRKRLWNGFKRHTLPYTPSSAREKRKFPAAPFTTSSLQQEASRKLGFTTAKTMQVVQQLYEGVDSEGRRHPGYCFLHPYATPFVSARKP